MLVKLTARQSRFVEEYLVDRNATQAAIRAGYSVRTAKVQAARLLTNVHLQRALTAAVSLRTERTQIDQDWVVAKLVENVEMAMRARPVLDRQGLPIGEFQYDGQVANSALKLLGEHLRMFPEKGMVLNQDNRAQVIDFTITFDKGDASKNGLYQG